MIALTPQALNAATLMVPFPMRFVALAYQTCEEGGHASALNNLASDRMMNECGIDRSERDVLKDELYASAKRLEGLQGDEDAKERKAALREARTTASILPTNDGGFPSFAATSR